MTSETLVRLLRDRMHLLLYVPFAGPFDPRCRRWWPALKPTKTPSAPKEHEVLVLRGQATRQRRRRSVVVQIGALNEGALHAQLKEWYRRPGDLLEQVAGGFVVDLVRGDLLVEIQTGGFAPLRRKLELLAQEHPVVVRKLPQRIPGRPPTKQRCRAAVDDVGGSACASQQ